tara:strand:- start:528 stop:1118 length:591 start_codon:yes stop_codon:yes gene_type:complete
MWHNMGVILSAADSLNWLASLTNSSVDSIVNTLPEKIKKPSGVQFLPYLAGERTPHNDASARGAFVGLQRTTSHQDLVQAVMEGVAFALTDCLKAMTVAGTELNSAFVVGGGCASPQWLEIISAAMNLDLLVSEQGHYGAALGAARLAFVAATGESIKDICLPPSVSNRVRANTSLTEQYQLSYEKYCTLYPSLYN